MLIRFLNVYLEKLGKKFHFFYSNVRFFLNEIENEEQKTIMGRFHQRFSNSFYAHFHFCPLGSAHVKA